jgi:plastocyanin
MTIRTTHRLASLVVAALGSLAVLLSMPVLLESQPLGSLTGTVEVARPPAAPAPTKVTRQTDVCGTSVASDAVVTGPGKTLAATAVWLEGVAKRAGVKGRDIALDQQRCRFVPRIHTATVGSTLLVTSRDRVLHNVHAFLGGRTLFNIAVPVPGMTIRKPLTEVGHVRFQCDAGHTWMAAHIRVFNHPYHATSSADGTFRIADVPPGTYRWKVWHETLGEKTASVTVAAGQAARVTIQY